MNPLKLIPYALLIALLISCSRFKGLTKASSDQEKDSQSIYDSMDDSILEEDGDEIAQGDELGEVLEDESVDEVLENAQDAAKEDAEIASGDVGESNEQLEEVARDVVSEGEEGQWREYVVKENDTLMWVAFQLYGDYLKWRILLRNNPGLSRNAPLSAGTVIRYSPPAEEFKWRPKGNPYVITRGDTLGLISGKVYGDAKMWKSIWDNNRRMIKNPNLIFAGFTLFYLDSDKIAFNK